MTVRDMGFETLDNAVDVFLVDSAVNCSFVDVNFMGPLTIADLDTDADNIAGVRFNSSASLICQSITFDQCTFTGTTYGINTDEQIQGITVSNSKFDTLFKGVVLGDVAPVSGGATGFRVLHNFFNNIYAQGVIFGAIELNATGHNIFYDVGNHFDGVTNPATSIISVENSNNVCIADMFERTAVYSDTYPRIDLFNQASIGMVSGSIIDIGPNAIEAQAEQTLVNNTVNQTFYTFSILIFRSVTINYSIVRDTGIRQGSLKIVPTGGGTLTYDDDYSENLSTGVTFSVSQSTNQVDVKYTTSNTGIDGTIVFSVSAFRI
jgi:hypothetical protein